MTSRTPRKRASAGDRPRAAPDRAAALDQYRRRALVYDLELSPFEPVRRRAIELLGLRPGDTVLDVGCGTGLSLQPLLDAVGPTGTIVGIDQSPEMVDVAKARARRGRWPNVRLVCSPAETAPIPVHDADAALFHFTHDILALPEAIGNVTRHLKPGAHVVACGLKWSGGWSPTNLVVLPAALHSVTCLEGLDRPWRGLEPLLDDLAVEITFAGGIYLAHGTLARRTPRKARALH